MLIRKILKHREPPFKVEGYHVSMRRDSATSVCEATVKVRVDGEVAHTMAEGDGPVNALDRRCATALIEVLSRNSRKCNSRITKCASSIPPPAPAPETRVLIESTDGKDEWGTVGVQREHHRSQSCRRLQMD